MRHDLYLQSCSLNDIREIPSRGYWDHTRKATKITNGDGIVVGVNSSIRKSMNGTDVAGYAGILIGVNSVPRNSDVWPSEEDGEAPATPFDTRYLLKDIIPITVTELDQILDGKTIPQSGMRYLNPSKEYKGQYTYRYKKAAVKSSKKIRNSRVPASDVLHQRYGNKILFDLHAKGFAKDQLITDRSNLTIEEFESKYNLAA